MPATKKKTVELTFVDKESVRNSVNIDQSAEEEPIAGRTRNRKKLPNSVSNTPLTKSKSRLSTPTVITPRTCTTSTTNTPSSRRSARIRQSFVKSPRRKLYDESPIRISKSRASVRLPSTDEEKDKRKVTPLKISTKFSEIPSASDDSSVEESTPNITKRSPFIKKLDLSEENVFRASPRENNFKATPSYRTHTPKTPSEVFNTPKTGSVNRLKRRLQRTPGTPSSARTLFTENSTAKTPRVARTKLKQKIQAKKLEEEEDYGSEVSELTEDSDDDFEPDSSDEKTSETDHEETPTKKSRTPSNKISSSPHPSGYTFRTNKRIDYNNLLSLNVDKYFEKKSAKSNFSKNALSSLPTPNVTDSDVNDIVSKNYVKHGYELEMLTEKYRAQFDKWLFYLKEGFNLMMYGVGSKLQILKLFQKEKLNESYVLTVNGFYPRFAIAELFRVLLNDILKASHCPRNLNDALIAAREELEESEFPVFIIINNIDGVALRGSKQQKILSKVAELPNIHIIATVDHINAPLLWGSNKMSAFNFLWLDVTTFNPYSIETTFENSLDIGNLGSDSSLATLNEVLKSAKTKDIFKLIVKHYMNNKNKKNYEGISLTELMQLAKDKFVVTSQVALREHLNKFIAHKIVSMKQSYVNILMNSNVLNTFCKQHISSDDDD